MYKRQVIRCLHTKLVRARPTKWRHPLWKQNGWDCARKAFLDVYKRQSKPSDEAVKKLHDCIDKVAVALGQDSTDVFRALLAKLIEQPEEKQTFDRLLEMAEKFAARRCV